MAKNIEIKASMEDIEFCLNKARVLAGCEPEIIKQEDYFFNCENGRLKLRIFSSDRGELIFYNRENISGPKTSEYYISGTDDPKELLHVLKKAYGIYGKVKKVRRLFIAGRTRIHLDQVVGLGDFLEFEVVLSENDKPADGEAEANRLLDQFGIKKSDLIECAYVDLISSSH